MSNSKHIEIVHNFYEKNWNVELVNIDRAFDIQNNGFFEWMKNKNDFELTYNRDLNIYLPNIRKIYDLKSDKYYKGYYLSNNFDFMDFFGKDRSYMKNGIFDTFDLIIEFELDNENEQLQINHHRYCYRGPLLEKNVKITKIIFNIFSDNDVHNIIEKILNTETVRKNKPEFMAGFIDTGKIDRVYVFTEF